MTDRYTFAPLLVDASPIPSRFAAPLDSGRRIVAHAVASALDSRTGSSPCPDNDACDYASL